MHTFDNTYAKWRRMMLRTNLILALLMLVVEIVMFFHLRQVNLILQETATYLFWFLYLPTAANALLISTGYLANRLIPDDSAFINYVPVVQQSLIALVAAGTHFTFSVTLCLFCFPLFATVIFSNRKMTIRIGIFSAVLLGFALVHRRVSLFADPNDQYYWAESIVAYAILAAATTSCLLLTRYQREKDGIINKGFRRQIEMQEQLHRDQKTGLFGHTIFMNQLESMVSQSEAEGSQLAVAMFDIDNFKQINDNYGHLKGDEVILKLAGYLKDNNPDKNLIARFGGDEFAILFCGSQVMCAEQFAESIRQGIAGQPLGFAAAQVTLSIGLAFWQPGWSMEDLIDQADMAMYAAKASGKNQTVVIDDQCHI